MKKKKARVLVAASSKARVKAIRAELQRVLSRQIDGVAGRDVPKSFAPYRLLVCELGARLSKPDHLLDEIRPDTHVVLIAPTLDVAAVSHWMERPQVDHVLHQETAGKHLRILVSQLESGSIFGLDQFLPSIAQVEYRRIRSFKQRCDVVDELGRYLAHVRLRKRIRQSSQEVAEELLMNAMYQAPLDEKGMKVFADISPAERVHRSTDRPVSIRYFAAPGSVFISVRDRFGSLDRDVVAHYLRRCVSGKGMEQKKLGAGLGLHMIAQRARSVFVNIMPGRVTEFVCSLGNTPNKRGLEVFSVSTQMS